VKAMAIYAFLDEKNKVTNIEVLNYNIESPYVIELQTYDPTIIGKIWDGENFIAKVETKERYELTRLEFRNRFKIEELALIYQKIDAGDITLRVIMDNFNVASYINIKDPLTLSGINYLISIGVLTQERANEVLQPILDVVEG
jgi:hypothetical protein